MHNQRYTFLSDVAFHRVILCESSNTVQHKLVGILMFSFNRIEHLWQDIWMAVSNVYYKVLHSLEDEGLLDPTDSVHLFCARHVFLPRLQRDLDVFRVDWDNHPLRTEQNLSPNNCGQWDSSRILLKLQTWQSQLL